MNQILFHIGYHKTGTTWLQNELFISSNNVFEPVSCSKSKKSWFGFNFVHHQDGYLLSPFDNNSGVIKKEFLRIISKKKNIDKKILVVSNERLCGHYLSGGFDSKLIAERIHHLFPHAKIFISIREQKSYILSSYFQYLSRGGLLNLKEYVNRRNHRIPGFDPSFLIYNELIMEYQRLFSRENVLVLPFEMFKNHSSEYLKRMETFIQRKIEFDINRFDVKHNLKRNYFILSKFKWLNLFRFSNMYNDFSRLHNRYSKSMANILYRFLKKNIPNSWNAKLINAYFDYINHWSKGRYIEHNRRLSEIIGLDLSKYGYF